MRIIFILIILLFGASSCKENSPSKDLLTEENEMLFDKEKWQLKADGKYVFRDRMYKYVLYDKEVRVMSKTTILSLLGEADKMEANHYYYNLNRTSIGLMTLHTKTLVIKFSDSETIEWIKIHE